MKEREAIVNILETAMNPITESKKTFRRQDGIGKAKYTISFHDGKKKHKDGSAFYDMKIFKNQKSMDQFVKDLKGQGYSEE